MKKAALMALVLALAGCANTPTVSFVDVSRYDASFPIYGARSGEMALVVLGNPTGEPQETVNAAVAEGLRGTHPNHRVPFVPSASSEAAGYRTVVVFGTTNANEICTLDAPRPVAGERIPVAAAFCIDREMFSYAQGITPRPANSGDPVLRRMISSLGLSIFPRRQVNERGNCRIGFGC